MCARCVRERACSGCARVCVCDVRVCSECTCMQGVSVSVRVCKVCVRERAVLVLGNGKKVNLECLLEDGPSVIDVQINEENLTCCA